MSDKPTLKLDWCSYAAAKYAVEHWHYSRTLTHTKLVRLGVWEDGTFCGAIIFGDGANKNMLTPYGLTYTQGCELVRVALAQHVTPSSRLLRIALRLLHQRCPHLRLVVSYADTAQGHIGVIYQAANWLYTGHTAAGETYVVRGKRFHSQALCRTRWTHRLGRLPTRNVLEWAQKVLDPSAARMRGSVKHRYLYPLDAAMRAQIAPLAQPYPKRATSIVADASAYPAEESGSTPTVALRR